MMSSATGIFLHKPALPAPISARQATRRILNAPLNPEAEMPPAPEYQAQRLRAELRRRRYQSVESLTLRELALLAGIVLDAGGDIDIAAAAVVMWPRPAWVTRIMGPGQMPDLELLHPDDRAVDGQW